MTIDKDWLAATLNDAYEALGEAVHTVENGDWEDAESVLRNQLVHIYAKLNYAVNTAELGANALNELSEDELIGWPQDMPFLTRDEIESIDAEGNDEDDRLDN